MGNDHDTSKHLLFLQSVNQDTDEEELIERLILKLEALGFNITGKKDEHVGKK